MTIYETFSWKQQAYSEIATLGKEKHDNLQVNHCHCSSNQLNWIFRNTLKQKFLQKFCGMSLEWTRLVDRPSFILPYLSQRLSNPFLPFMKREKPPDTFPFFARKRECKMILKKIEIDFCFMRTSIAFTFYRNLVLIIFITFSYLLYVVFHLFSVFFHFFKNILCNFFIKGHRFVSC